MQFFIEKISFPSTVSKLFSDSGTIAKVKQRTGDVVVRYSICLQDDPYIKTDMEEITGTFTISEEKYLENSKPDELIQLIKNHFHEANKL